MLICNLLNVYKLWYQCLFKLPFTAQRLTSKCTMGARCLKFLWQILGGNRLLLLVLAALEKVQHGAAGYVFNNYSNCTPGCMISMLADLKWKHLEQQRLCKWLTMLYKTNHIVDINRQQFNHKGDQRTRGAQRLYHVRSVHPVLWNSFFPSTLSLRNWNELPSWLDCKFASTSLETFHFQCGLCRCIQSMLSPKP